MCIHTAYTSINAPVSRSGRLYRANYNIAPGRYRGPLANATSAGHIQRYAKSGLSLKQMAQVKQQLDELMQTEKLYLQANLTLPELAETLDCTVNHVSQAINASFGVSFFDFINGFRVQEAMRLLADSRNAEMQNPRY